MGCFNTWDPGGCGCCPLSNMTTAGIHCTVKVGTASVTFAANHQANPVPGIDEWWWASGTVFGHGLQFAGIAHSTVDDVWEYAYWTCSSNCWTYYCPGFPAHGEFLSQNSGSCAGGPPPLAASQLALVSASSSPMNIVFDAPGAGFATRITFTA